MRLNRLMTIMTQVGSPLSQGWARKWRLGLVLGVASAALVAGCVALARGGAQNAPGEPRVLSAAAEKELTFSDSKLGVVFAIDGEGNIQAFRREGTQPLDLKLPLHADQVEAFLALTVIKTSNPKVCWTTTYGSLKCITY